MPDDIYEVIALAARYWFLFLMLLITWRSYRWYVKDRKKFKKRLRLLPDAGYIGELIVVQGDETVQKRDSFLVSREGVLGFLRNNDVSIPADGIANRHLWYSFDEVDGLRVEPLRGRMIVADGVERIGRRQHAFLTHGSLLQVGQAKLRLRLFSGFEVEGEAEARRRPLDDADPFAIPEELENAPPSDRVRRMHEIAAWQALQEEEEAQESGIAEDAFMEEDEFATEPERDYDQPAEDRESAWDGEPEYTHPIADAQQASYRPFAAVEETTAEDEPVFYPPVMDTEDEQQAGPTFYPPVMEDDDEEEEEDPCPERESVYGSPYEPHEDSPVYYPPVMDPADEEDLPPLDENGNAPRSLYVEPDDAEVAKRVLWDKYFKGGDRR